MTEMKHPAGIIVQADYEGQKEDFSCFHYPVPLRGRLHLTLEGRLETSLDYWHKPMSRINKGQAVNLN